MEIKTQRKLDYLADTKADIKAALIEKGQAVSDADPFRSYGDKVRAIETGGGGGSLPAGVYWQQDTIPLPNANYQVWFTYKGVLHAITQVSGTSSSTGTIHKYENGAWTQVATAPSFNSFNFIRDCKVYEFHGKVYFFNSEFANYGIWDGSSTVAIYTNAPKGYKNFVFVCGDKLRLYSYTEGGVYVFDETNNTWALEHTPGAKYAYYYFYPVGDKVFAQNNKVMYEYDCDTGTLTKVGDLLDTGVDSAVVVGNYLYRFASTTSAAGGSVLRYDTTTHTDKNVGTTPPVGSISNTSAKISAAYYDGVRLVGTNKTLKYNFLMYEVEETE